MDSPSIVSSKHVINIQQYKGAELVLLATVASCPLCLQVVQYKQQSRLEEKRKKALDLQLDFIVGQTEKYSDLLSKSLGPSRPAETVLVTPQKAQPAPAAEDDGEQSGSSILAVNAARPEKLSQLNH